MTDLKVRTYAPRGACRQVLECRDPEVVLSGPAGTGKSRACLEKLHMVAQKYPGMRGLILRKTLTSLGSTALVTWREHVVKEALHSGMLHFYGGSSQEAAAYRYQNGSTIVVGGLDKSTRIMSSEYDMVYVQEAIELTSTDWEAVTTRLRNGVLPYQQLIADTNPDTPTHWLRQRCDTGTTRLLPCHHEDNPRLYSPNGERTPEGVAYIGKLDNLTGVRHSRLRHGLWVAAEGVIYEEWDEGAHVLDHGPVPDAWRRVWSIDFGFTNPFSLQCWAVSPDDQMILYREIYHTGRTVDEHARTIMGIVAPGGVWIEPRPSLVTCDHDAEGRATWSAVTGLATRPADKRVSEGIQAVQRRLRARGDGSPGLALMRGTVVERDAGLTDAMRPGSTLEEVPGYVWDRGVGKAPKEAPLKVDDHGMDAMRYAVMALERPTSPRVRFI